MISVGKVMSYNVSPLFATQTLKDVKVVLENSSLCGLPVVDHNHKVLGVLFKDCNLHKFREDTPLEKVMSRQTPAVDRSFPANKALGLNVQLLPVVNSKKQYLGIVTREALEQALLTEDIVQEVKLVNRYEHCFSRPDSKEPLTYPDLVKDSKELKERTQMLHRIGLITYAPEMMDLVELGLRVAKVTSTVLIFGESGVGKELFAKLLHEHSPRSAAPFLKVNCAAIPESLLESELFGYDSGAFTGASKQGKLGMFELAHRGTLFLDEIGELPLSLQVKILRAIQEQEILRIGGIKTRKVDIRFIAATNRDLEKMVNEGRFREDLYFRLNVIPLHVPPLRQRKHDILPLVHHFQQKFARKLSIEKEFAPEVLKAFYNYNWPGNVRELENIIERLFVITPERVVSQKYLNAKFLPGTRNHAKTTQEIMPFKEAMLTFELSLIEQAIQMHGNLQKAAGALQIDQATLVRKWSRLKESAKKYQEEM